MNAKTAGQAADKAFTDACGKGLGSIAAWEAAAQAARDWQPPAEKTLGEVVQDIFGPDRSGYHAPMDKCQAAGEACARIGAERERAWWRAWIAENCGDCDDVEQMLAVLADRGKEQQP